MKKSSILLSICLALFGVACNSSREKEVVSFDFDNTCWFDGYEFFVGSTDTASAGLYNFAGGTLHEGGSTFALRQIAVDTFVIQPVVGESWVAMGVEGDTAVREPYGDLSIIVCHNPEDPECDTLWQYDPGNKTPMEAYRDLLVAHRLNDLVGTYTDAKGKLTYQFADSVLIRTYENGKADTQSFHFFYSFDMPSHILCLSNKEELWYEKTDKGLDLFKVTYDASVQDYIRGMLFAKFEKQR